MPDDRPCGHRWLVLHNMCWKIMGLYPSVTQVFQPWPVPTQSWDCCGPKGKAEITQPCFNHFKDAFLRVLPYLHDQHHMYHSSCFWSPLKLWEKQDKLWLNHGIVERNTSSQNACHLGMKWLCHSWDVHSAQNDNADGSSYENLTTMLKIYDPPDRLTFFYMSL